MKQGDLISLVENFNMKKSVDTMNENINTFINWDDLSGSEQMAVEFAENDIKKGIDVKTAAIQACYRVSEGNADAAYEDEDFYMEEPDYKKVVTFLEQEQ